MNNFVEFSMTNKNSNKINRSEIQQSNTFIRKEVRRKFRMRKVES
jgi:hypothetical protein